MLSFMLKKFLESLNQTVVVWFDIDELILKLFFYPSKLTVYSWSKLRHHQAQHFLEFLFHLNCDFKFDIFQFFFQIAFISFGDDLHWRINTLYVFKLPWKGIWDSIVIACISHWFRWFLPGKVIDIWKTRSWEKYGLRLSFQVQRLIIGRVAFAAFAWCSCCHVVCSFSITTWFGWFVQSFGALWRF